MALARCFVLIGVPSALGPASGFELPLEGSLFYVAALMLLLGLTGMSFGLLISASAESEVAAMQMVRRLRHRFGRGWGEGAISRLFQLYATPHA